MNPHILDSNALYSFFRSRSGSEIVRKLLEEALVDNEKLLICSVNWGEVYYTIAREAGYRDADHISQLVETLPLTIVDASRELAEAAGRLKAGYGLPYADCFAAALAGKSGIVVTADVKDFKKVPWVKTLPLPSAKRS